MTLDQFIEKYNGKFVEYHSFSAGAKNQCVDLANQYIVEVLGLPAIIGTNAQDFPKKAGENYTWIANTPTGIPKKGDLMIFKSPDGVGHISIFMTGDTMKFTSFDQNYPTGSPCKLVSHNYGNVLGWLHPKGSMTMYQGYDLNNPESMKVAVDVLVRLQKGELVDKSKVLEVEEELRQSAVIRNNLSIENDKLKKELAAKDVDMSKWVLNGLQVQEGNKTFNYKLK